MEQPSPGGSFLGTAAAAAVGVVGGSLLMDGIRSMMMGHHGGSAHAAFDPAGGGHGSPWGGGGNPGDGNLAHGLGRDDIGRSSGTGGGAPRSQGVMDDDSNENVDANHGDANYASDDDPSYAADDQNDMPEFEDDSDFGGDFGGGGGDE